MQTTVLRHAGSHCVRSGGHRRIVRLRRPAGQSGRGGVVARVTGTEITAARLAPHERAQFIRQGLDPSWYRPPRYAGCVADLRRQNVPAVVARGQCRRQSRQQRAGALHLVLRRTWLEHEAKRHGVVVDEAVARQQLRKSHPAPSLRAWMVEQLRIGHKLERRVAARISIAPAAIQRYYERNRASFADQRLRSFRLLTFPSFGAGAMAKEALTSGSSWREVAARYTGSARNGNEDRHARTAFSDPVLRRAMFSLSRCTVYNGHPARRSGRLVRLHGSSKAAAGAANAGPGPADHPALAANRGAGAAVAETGTPLSPPAPRSSGLQKCPSAARLPRIEPHRCDWGTTRPTTSPTTTRSGGGRSPTTAASTSG